MHQMKIFVWTYTDSAADGQRKVMIESLRVSEYNRIWVQA